MIKRNQAKKTRSDKNTKRSNRLQKRRRLQMEGLEERRLLAVLTDLPHAPAPDLTEYTFNRNVGAVQSFTFNESENFLEYGLNDSTSTADAVPIGTGFGQQNTVDIFGALPVRSEQTQTGFSADLDTFAMTMRGGDILDIAVLGAATQFIIRDDLDGQVIFGSSSTLFSDPPFGDHAPRQTLGNATGTFVIPRDGTYNLTVAPDVVGILGAYTIGLRAYRPVTEELAVGDAQIVYLDFNGDVIDGNLVGLSGFVRIPSLVESLPLMGIEPGNIIAANNIIDRVIDGTVRIFEDLTETGENGDYTESSVPGEYAVRILNSRDHAGLISMNDPRLTRLMIGGSGLDINFDGVYGYAQSVDLGNFDLSEYGFFALDLFGEDAQDAIDGGISPNNSQVDFIGDFLAAVVAHEAGHTLGMAHTNGDNFTGTLSDEGSANSIPYFQSLGPDGIYGTTDDVPPVFADDFYSVVEGFIGTNEITNTLAHLLSSGTQGGGTVSGQVFFDENLNGTSTGDGGLQGVTVFADINDDGIYTTGEPTTVTESNGVFSLSVTAGTVDIRAVAPTQYLATTATSRTINVPQSGTVSGLEFGFGIVSGLNTGFAFDDLDGDGIMDANEPLLEDVYIYLDADGDNRPDLGEASTRTAENGSYFFNFGETGEYVIRAVPTPGYQVSYPTSGEHVITFNGIAAANEYNFGFLSTLDFGDAPNSYGTSLPDGARHGIVDGLAIGTAPDRDVDGIPSIDADSDDLNRVVNDEDGVLQTTPLAPGDTANFDVTITNTTGSTAYLQGFIDFNQDGDFDDAGEKFLSNRQINSGVTNVIYPITVPVPSDASTGDTFARFRLSKTGNLGASGFAGTGEVQDHKVTILSGSDIANDDYFEVARNSISTPLDVLANDFQLAGNQLIIDSLNTIGTIGFVAPPTNNQLFYTPPSGFIGLDTFSYTVRDQFGNTATASVFIDVKYQSNVPIALDDIYGVPTNSVNRPLAVLDNDISSINGGISITSASAGTSGGSISVVAGGQSIRYTPSAGFTGTEQFSYTIQDGAGLVDTATVTVNMMPDSLDDDLIEFDIEIIDAVNGNAIDHVSVGDEFTVRVTVDDLRMGSPNGVTSAFMDLLYTSDLVSTVDSDPNDGFNFDIAFGPFFSGAGTFQLGNADVPGLLDEVGSTQDFGNLQQHPGPVTLFEATMRANAAGIAQFMGDPTNTPQAETILFDEDEALTIQQLRFNSTQLTVLPSSEFVTAAVDDSFPDNLDSLGDVIINSSPERSVLRVLDNDNLGITGTITEFDLQDNPSKGTAFVDDNGTSNDFGDDFISYKPNTGATGLEQFSYFVVTSEGVVTSANVTISLGDQQTEALVEFSFSLVNRAGDALDPSQITVGDEIGLQVHVDDTREVGLATLVYAGYLDVLYAADNLSPVEPSSGSNFNFDLDFGLKFDDLAGSGTAAVPGIIDEVGSLRTSATFNFPYTSDDPAELVTIYFDVTAPGTVLFKGSPSDLSPQHDTLVFLDNDPVEISDIKHSVLEITIEPAGAQGQNQGNNGDVNNDGFVSPIDALLIVNRLALIGEGESGSDDSASKIYPDVNGDGSVTGLDVNLVLIIMMELANDGEGEQLISPDSDRVSGNSNSADAVFTVLGTSDLSSLDKIAITDCPKAPEVLDPTESATRKDAQDDEEENGVLDLLAGDVEQVWS